MTVFEAGDSLITIKRAYLPFGTFGQLFAPEFSCFTVERPWLGNEPWVSCIPEGTYPFAPDTWFSREEMPVIGIYNVAGRSRILIHPGNWPHNVQGCIAVGEEIACINGKLGVTNSRKTFNRLMRLFGETTARITVMKGGP